MGEPRPDELTKLLGRIDSRTAKVGIIGLGYVGLPLARSFCRSGFPVIGFDTDAAKVARLSRGKSYIGHIDDATIAAMIQAGFAPTSQFERLVEADAILICVPTPLTEAKDPDLQYVVKSAEAIADRLRSGQLVVLESTTYPGTTRDVMLTILEAKGLRIDQEFFLAFSPEREDPGNPNFSTATIPKVVGGIGPSSLRAASHLYQQVVDRVVPVDTLEIAEACKILENTYRAVNIALVNELKVLFERMGIDVWKVIEAAKSKPFGFQEFQPGPGLGGHCIPIDPFYLAWIARKHGMTTRFIELAGEINTSMPKYVVEKIADALNDRGKPLKRSQILLLGMAYKKDVDDPRESPGFEIMDQLIAKGAEVSYNDPHIPKLPSMRRYPDRDFASQTLTAEYLASRDCVVVVTNHSAYDWNFVVEHASLIVDTRNATRGVPTDPTKVVRA